MNTENHEIPEIPENGLCLLRFAAQTPCTKGNRAAMAALNAYALTLPWEGATPLVCIKQEVVYLTSAYVAQAPDPEPVEWHNPDNLTPEQVGEGFRLLAVGEGVPEGAQYYKPEMEQFPWGRSNLRPGSRPVTQFTYRTNLPYHPSR